MFLLRLFFALSCTCAALFCSGEAVAEDSGVRVTFESVTPAGQLINRKVVANDGVLVGTLADVVIDRNRGRVVMFVVNSHRAANTADRNYFLPAAVVDPDVDQLRLRLTLNYEDVEHAGDIVDAMPASRLSDAAVAEIYRHFQVAPFWMSSADSDQSLSLVTVDEMDGRIIRDDKWHILARVRELLIAPHDDWTVAYLGLGELSDQQASKRIAVPMSAFVHRSYSPTWLLDVSTDAELLKQTFETGEWPTEIDRGWIEFTHVKYGRSAVDGVQNSGP